MVDYKSTAAQQPRQGDSTGMTAVDVWAAGLSWVSAVSGQPARFLTASSR